VFTGLSALFSASSFAPNRSIRVKTGLEAVGINRSKVFEPAAVDLLVRATAGVPRSVCLLARAAWLEAARTDIREISAQTLQQAMEQVPGLAGLTRHNP